MFLVVVIVVVGHFLHESFHHEGGNGSNLVNHIISNMWYITILINMMIYDGNAFGIGQQMFRRSQAIAALGIDQGQPIEIGQVGG